jgi:hypothetical protein
MFEKEMFCFYSENKTIPETLPLKRPKLETFGSGVFTQIRPVWVGNFGARPKDSKF